MRANRPLRIAILLTGLAAIPAWRPAEGALSGEERQVLLTQAGEFFHKGNEAAATDPLLARSYYEKALLRFERLEREGEIRNGKLYYNIANTHSRLGDLGRAILNYRRAQRYLPNDENLRQNLEYARSRRVDRIEETARTRVLKTLLFWHYDLSASARSLILAVFFVSFWLGASIRLFSKKAVPRWAVGLFGVVVLLMLGSLGSQHALQSRNRPGVVLAQEVIARRGDSDSYEPAFKKPLHAATEFILIEDRGDWYLIELSDASRCWIPASSAALV